MDSYIFDYAPDLDRAHEVDIENGDDVLHFALSTRLEVLDHGPDGEPLKICARVAVVEVVLLCSECDGEHVLPKDMAMLATLTHWVDIEAALADADCDHDEHRHAH